MVATSHCPHCNDSGICPTCEGEGAVKIMAKGEAALRIVICPDCEGLCFCSRCTWLKLAKPSNGTGTHQ